MKNSSEHSAMPFDLFDLTGKVAIIMSSSRCIGPLRYRENSGAKDVLPEDNQIIRIYEQYAQIRLFGALRTSIAADAAQPRIT